MSEKAIYDALRASKTVDEGELVERINFLRRFLFSRLNYDERNLPRPKASNLVRGPTAQTADKIVRLLQAEGRLNSPRAAATLIESMAEDEIDVAHLPKFRAKEGLRYWIMQLPVSSSELLHHATKIRNKLVHSDSVAWPLRDRSS